MKLATKFEKKRIFFTFSTMYLPENSKYFFPFFIGFGKYPLYRIDGWLLWIWSLAIEHELKYIENKCYSKYLSTPKNKCEFYLFNV